MSFMVLWGLHTVGIPSQVLFYWMKNKTQHGWPCMDLNAFTNYPWGEWLLRRWLIGEVKLYDQNGCWGLIKKGAKELTSVCLNFLRVSKLSLWTLSKRSFNPAFMAGLLSLCHKVGRKSWSSLSVWRYLYMQCQCFTSVMIEFWWSSGSQKDKIPWVAWQKLCRSN